MRMSSLGAFALCFATISCSGSSGLNRSEALKIVQAHDLNAGFPDSLTVYVSLPTALFYDPPGTPWDTQEQASGIMRTELANLDFYKGLISLGWLKEESSCRSLAQMPKRTYHCYASIGSFTNMDNTPLGERGTLNDHGLRIAMAKLSGETVTGIAEGSSPNQAVVEVEYDVSPTPAYQAYMTLANQMNRKYPNIVNTSYPFVSAPQWVTSPVSSELTKQLRKQYSFQKFDDGWRAIM